MSAIVYISLPTQRTQRLRVFCFPLKDLNCYEILIFLRAGKMRGSGGVQREKKGRNVASLGYIVKIQSLTCKLVVGLAH